MVKGPKWLWVFVFRATELSIEYVYCGLRAGPVNIYIIEFYLEGNNYSICQSSIMTVVYGLAQ